MKDKVTLPVPGVINLVSSLYYTYWTYLSEIWGLAGMYEVMTELEKDPDNGFWFRLFCGFGVYGIVAIVIGKLLSGVRQRALSEYEMTVKSWDDIPDGGPGSDCEHGECDHDSCRGE